MRRVAKRAYLRLVKKFRKKVKKPVILESKEKPITVEKMLDYLVYRVEVVGRNKKEISPRVLEEIRELSPSLTKEELSKKLEEAYDRYFNQQKVKVVV